MIASAKTINTNSTPRRLRGSTVTGAATLMISSSVRGLRSGWASASPAGWGSGCRFRGLTAMRASGSGGEDGDRGRVAPLLAAQRSAASTSSSTVWWAEERVGTSMLARTLSW